MNSLLCIKEALQLLLDIFRRLMSNQHADLQEGLQVSLCMMLHGLFCLQIFQDLSEVVQKSEPYYFDYGEYEDLWKAKTIRSKGYSSELQRQVGRKVPQITHNLRPMTAKLVIKVIRGIVHDESRKLDITKVLILQSRIEMHCSQYLTISDFWR